MTGAADLRLLVPALACWAGAWVAVTFPTATGLVTGTAAAVLAAGASVAWRRRAAAPWRVALAAAALAAAAGLGLGALRVAGLHAGPVDELAAERAEVSVTGVVTADPRRHAPRTTGDQLGRALTVVPLRVDGLVARGVRLRARAPVLVLAGVGGWGRLLPGQRVAAAGRLGPAYPGQPLAGVLSVRGPPDLVGRPPAVQSAAGGLRAGLRRAVAGLAPEPRGLVPGLVLGDTSRMPDRLDEDFRTAGLTHLTAVSGANLVIVVGFVLYAGRWLGVRGRWLPLLGGLALVGFVVLARPQPSVLRAAAMGAVGLLGLATGRARAGLAALAAAMLVLLLADPWLARSYGFVLSVLATCGLLVLAGPWARRLSRRGVPMPLAHAVTVPVAAQVACAPVVVLLSGEVSLVAVPANLLAAPAVAPATVLGVLATLVAVPSGWAAGLVGAAAGLPATWIVVVAERAAALPSSSVAWPASPAGALALAAGSALVVAAAVWLGHRRRLRLLSAVLVGVLVGAVTAATQPGWPPRGWLLVACDVGQGDALVLSAGAAGSVVVDAGPDPRLVDRCLRSLGVDSVALLVLTHLHADHVEGVPGVLRGRRVGAVLTGPYDEPATELARVRGWARAAGVPVREAVLGERAALGALSYEVLWPARVIAEDSVANNASLVLLARRAGVRMLLTGDVEPPAQRALLTRQQVLAGGPVDVLKVAHHGSAYQEPGLLTALRPRVALVSAGEGNDYGHPAPVTLRRLRALGAVVGRTDRDGALAVVVDGAAGGRLRLVRAGG